MIYFSIAFVVAAGLGAYFRLQTQNWLVSPWGTLAVNVVGSLLLGVLAVYLAKSAPSTRVILMVGFLGALTTFSGYALDLVRLFDEGMVGKALLYLFSSNVLCFLACYGGWKIAQKLVISP